MERWSLSSIESRVLASNIDGFLLKSQTQAEEDAYDLTQNRPSREYSGKIHTIGYLVKGSLGIGLLGGHEAFQKCGLVPSFILQVFSGVYMGYCIYVLIRSSHIIYKRLHAYNMTYPDIGEAALAMCPNKKLARFHKYYRHFIDVILCVDLFGACACYQLAMSQTLKQLMENDPNTKVAGIPGYPSLRVYLIIMTVPCIMISLITDLKYLEKFTMLANSFIVLVIFTTIYYSFNLNPSFEGLKLYGHLNKIFTFLAITEFNIACSGMVIPVCNNMKEPEKCGLVIGWSMFITVFFLFTISFFGMNAYREHCYTPITLNFPTSLFASILKALIAFAIYVTYSLIFYTPFHLCWHYLKKLHARHFYSQNKMLQIEKVYRAVFVVGISAIAITFPRIGAVTAFTGSLCISNMAFIWPNIIEILVIWPRPGFGRYYWRLWKAFVLICIGVVLMVAGTIVNARQMFRTFYLE